MCLFSGVWPLAITRAVYGSGITTNNENDINTRKYPFITRISQQNWYTGVTWKWAAWNKYKITVVLGHEQQKQKYI